MPQMACPAIEEQASCVQVGLFGVPLIEMKTGLSARHAKHRSLPADPSRF